MNETIVGRISNTPPTSGDDFARVPPEQQKVLDTLYDAKTQPQKEMYPIEGALRPAFRARDNELADVLGLSSDQRAMKQKGFIEDFGPSRLDAHTVGQRLYNAVVDADLADARGTDDSGQLAQRIQEDNETVRAELASVYGREESEDLLFRANEFTKQQFPKLHAMLARRGIGSRRDIVIPIVEHVRRINFRG